MAWIDDVTEKVARAAGTESSHLALPPEIRREILDLARVASHSSGDRINAPLLCYVLGLAVGSGAKLADVAAAVRAAAEVS